MTDEEFGSFKLSKLKYRREDQIIQPFCRIGSLKKLGLPSLTWRKFQKPEESTAESLKSNEWQTIRVLQTSKIEIQVGGGQIIQPFCRIGSPQEIRTPLFNLVNFQKAEKGTVESYKMQWNLMNDEKFGSFKLLKLKYRRGDQII